MAAQSSRVRRFVVRVVNDDNLDLYVLAIAALVFTVLGTVGLADVKTLSSVLLALLAYLALSQIKSRRQVAQLDVGRRAGAVFGGSFPPDLLARRETASSLLLIGVSMNRTVQGMRTDLRPILRSGGRVRVAVVDPTDDALLAVAAARAAAETPAALRRRILMTLEVLTAVQAETQGRLEIRVLSHVPSAGLNGVDLDGARGLVCVQHFEYRPGAEPAPIFTLEPGHGEWYRHFVSEAERIWESATPWPLTPDLELARAAPVGFTDAFGPELDRFIDLSQALFVTGVGRNTFVHNHYHMLEKYLAAGRSMRVLLVDPASAALQIAANRWYVDRTAEGAQQRLENTLRTLAALRQATGGDLTVRLTDHPLAVSIIATEPLPIVFAGYYPYKTRAEPKFVLRGDDPWRQHFLDEAEALWASATPYEFPVI